MRVGHHCVTITPPIPCGMGGYADRSGAAEGVHDPLFARALVLEAGGERLGILTCDILHLDRTLVEEVRARTAALTGIAPERVMLLASHTHSGPSPATWASHPAPPEYLRWLPLQLAGCLLQATRNMEEVEVAWGEAPVEGLGTNRTDPDLPFDPTLRLLAFLRGGRPRAVLLNYGCHPTVMGPENRLISADWPGAGVAALQRALGDGVWVGFAQGCAGDVSARFTRRAQSFAEVERHGWLLAGAALTALGRLCGPAAGVGGRPVRLAARRQVVRLEPRRLPSPEEAARQVEAARARVAELQAAGASHAELRIAQTALQGAELALRYATQGIPIDLNCEVQAFAIGDAALVSLAGEPFSALGRAIRARSPFAATLVAGYGNGYCGYIPDREAFARGGYEALSAPSEPGSGERLVEVALELLSELKAEVTG